MPRMKRNRDYIYKDLFIRLLSKESGFTLEDTRAFWKAVEKIVAYALISGKSLSIGGFGQFYSTDVDVSKPWWDEVHKQYYMRKPHKRIGFRMSSTIRNLLKEYENLDLEISDEDLDNQKED